MPVPLLEITSESFSRKYACVTLDINEQVPAGNLLNDYKIFASFLTPLAFSNKESSRFNLLASVLLPDTFTSGKM
jgi:hypothetical protein